MLHEQINERSLVTFQECFVHNKFPNQPLSCNLTKNSFFGKRKLSSRGSYGSLYQNRNDQLKFTVKDSIKDYMIPSDAMQKNQKKKKQFIKIQKQKSISHQRQLRKTPVNIDSYNRFVKNQQIADAYYFVNKEMKEAKKRQQKKLETIKRVKSLSRSKSKEQSLQFRNKEQLKFNCVKHLQQLKETYRNQIVPELMGTFCQVKYPGNVQKKDILIRKENKQIQIQESIRPSQKINGAQTAQSLFEFRLSSRNGFKSSKTLKEINKVNLNSQQEAFSITNRTSYNDQILSKATKFAQRADNSDLLMNNLKKCKSTEEFIKRQRVKIIKQAFIENWRQGNNKKQENHKNIYPCRQTLKIQQEKNKAKQAQKRHQKQLIYGQTYFNNNPIKKLPKDSQSNLVIQRYNTLKQYQLQFQKIAKTSINSCVVANF